MTEEDWCILEAQLAIAGVRNVKLNKYETGMSQTLIYWIDVFPITKYRRISVYDPAYAQGSWKICLFDHSYIKQTWHVGTTEQAAGIVAMIWRGELI